MKGTLLAFAVAAFAMAGATAQADVFTIAARNRPADLSVVVTKATPSAIYAAEEFCDYVKRMTGVALPVLKEPADYPGRAVVISVSGGDADAFRLRVEGSHLLVTGGKRGVLYGVYELLETYGGVGWFSSWCETVPELEAFVVPGDLDRTEKPAFEMREVFWKDAFNGDFAARLRSNGDTAETGPRHGDDGKTFGGGLFIAHTFDVLLPPEKYFREHPEYFAEVDGKRLDRMTQPCLSNPAVLKIVVSNLLERIAADPDAPCYGVSQNDNDNYCRCARCAELDRREGSPAASVVRFVNAVADAVSRRYPGKTIETLAYWYSRKPPRTLRYRDDVMPCLCSLECDFSKPIPLSCDRDCVKFRSDIEGWFPVVRRLYVWDYETNFHHYPAPFRNLRSIQGNIRYFRDHGVWGIFEQGAWQGWHGEFAELKAWLTAKWMWNPELDRKKLVNRFLKGYYGKAAPMVADYLKLLYAKPVDETVTPVKIFDSVAGDRSLTPEFLKRARELWNGAAAAVADDPVRSYNVRMGAMSVDYADYIRNFKVANVSRRAAPSDPDLPKRLHAAFQEAEKRGRPVYLCENWSENASRHGEIARAAAGRTYGDGNRAVMGEDAFLLCGCARNEAEIMDDPRASGGKAVRLLCDNWDWHVQWDLNQVAYDPGRTYRFRLRVRAELLGPDGNVFTFGVYDKRAKRSVLQANFSRGDIRGDDYAWYESPEWAPQPDQTFWFAPAQFDVEKSSSSPVCRSLWVDSMEIVAQDPKQ